MKRHPIHRLVDSTGEKLITAVEASRLVGLSPHIIRKLCKQKEIQAHMILGQWRISRASLERYMIKTQNVS